MVPPDSPGITRVPGYSGFHWRCSVFTYGGVTLYARLFQVVPLTFQLPYCGPTTPQQKPAMVWAIPRSLAATDGVSFDFLSSGYLDVSVPRVGSLAGSATLLALGFPIRTPSDHRVLARFPKLIAGSCVLHRLLLPRHPPCALCS